MPYRPLGDIATADTAFEAIGATVEQLFIEAGDALLNTMTEDFATISPQETVEFQVQNADLDLLLFDMLSELVFFKDARRLLLRIDSIRINHDQDGYQAQVIAVGEPIDPARHRLLIDVKAVTLHRLSVDQLPDCWKAVVVLDI